MGFYIETGGTKGKAAWLVEHHFGVLIPEPFWFTDIDPLKGLVCVVDNGPFEAAAYCFGENEFKAFHGGDYSTDRRPKTWVLVDKAVAEKLSGYNR